MKLHALLTHCGVHDAGAVGADGVGNVTDIDGVQVLVVACLLYEDLVKKKKKNLNTAYKTVSLQTKRCSAYLVVEVIKVT